MTTHPTRLLGATLLLTSSLTMARADTADLIVTNANIHTSDAGHQVVEAMAVKDGKIVFTGAAADAMKWKGPQTEIQSLGGKTVLPGLIDMHIHPLGIVDLDTCDLKGASLDLKGLSDFVKGCIDRMHIPEGEWVMVDLWNFSDNNAGSAGYETIRAALDKASTKHPIKLYGADGHHYGFNSSALALAKNRKGETVGLSKATMTGEFADMKALVGVDARGEPDGYVTEAAANLMPASWILERNFAEIMKAPERITARLAENGITAFQDAAAAPATTAVYDKIQDMGKLTAHVRLAQFYNFGDYADAAGKVDFDRMVRDAEAIRAKYAGNPLIRADAVKLFADGVLEGNPAGNPPTLPSGAMLHAYQQPIFGIDAKGRRTIKGYVDTGSKLCADARAGHPDPVAFQKKNGYHPDQCTVSNGVLEHPEADLKAFVKHFHEKDFTLHIHAIGDRAVRASVDAIEAARAADGVSIQPDAIGHIQLIDPADVARIGKNKIYLTFTFAWANTLKDYDLTVMPFIDKLKSTSDADMYTTANYTYRQTYPAQQALKAGAIITGGSDAPVETRDPRPFYNIQYAVTRQHPGLPPMNPAEALTIEQAVDAYTINGARAMRMGDRIGSLEAGKDADFIVLDRDIFELAKDSNARQTIKDTRVLETRLAGKVVYRAEK